MGGEGKGEMGGEMEGEVRRGRMGNRRGFSNTHLMFRNDSKGYDHS